MTPTSETNSSKARLWAGRILGVFVTLAFMGSAISKLAHVPKVIEELTRAGIPEGAIVPIAILELWCLALYLFPRTSVLGAFLLTGYIGGAIVTHIIGRQNFVAPLIIGLLMFASTYLRHSELRELVPFRSSPPASDRAPQRAVSVAS